MANENNKRWLENLKKDPDKWNEYVEKRKIAQAKWRVKNGKSPLVKLTDDEKKARAKAAQEAWRRGKGIMPRVKKEPKVKIVKVKVVKVVVKKAPRVRLTEEEKKARAKATRTAWNRARGIMPRKPKVVTTNVARILKTETEKAETLRLSRVRARDKRRAGKPVRVLLTDEQKREKKRVDRLIARSRKSRTPEGLLKVLKGLKWAKVRDAYDGWITAGWTAQALSVFPYQECCDWLERNGYGVKAVGGTMLEFRFDKRFDIAGDSPLVVLGHKRIRNLDGILDWLEMVGCYFPQEWIELDFEPDRYMFADCLRNVLGTDLTKIKTVVGATNKRFPVTMNLAAIENFIEYHGMQGELYRRYMIKEGMAYIGIQLRDRTLWKTAIRDDGTLEDSAFVEAVDILKALPNKQWDVPDNEGVNGFIDGLNE